MGHLDFTGNLGDTINGIDKRRDSIVNIGSFENANFWVSTLHSSSILSSCDCNRDKISNCWNKIIDFLIFVCDENTINISAKSCTILAENIFSIAQTYNLVGIKMTSNDPASGTYR